MIDFPRVSCYIKSTDAIQFPFGAKLPLRRCFFTVECNMGFAELLLLGVGLSMDAFAVSVCKGLAMKKATLKAELTCGVWFGGFQALMPLIGFYLGTLFAEAIQWSMAEMASKNRVPRK